MEPIVISWGRTYPHCLSYAYDCLFEEGGRGYGDVQSSLWIHYWELLFLSCLSTFCYDDLMMVLLIRSHFFGHAVVCSILKQ